MSASLCPEARRLYARVANFPNKIDNLRAKIATMRDEAEELGFRDEARQLAALAVFADGLPRSREQVLSPWTAEDVLTLKRLWLEGVLIAEIGRRLGRSERAIQAAARKHNLPLRKPRLGQ